MAKVGYVNSWNDENYKIEQLQKISQQNVSFILFEFDDNVGLCQKDLVINNITNKLKPGDSLIVYDFFSLGKTMKQFSDFILKLQKANISLVILKKFKTAESIKDSLLIEILLEMAEIEDQITSKRVSHGIKKAILEGKKVGRPKITQNQINTIRSLYKNRRMTLREISEKTDTSLGTVYKYISKEDSN